MNHQHVYDALITHARPRGQLPFTTSTNKRKGFAHHHIIPRALDGGDEADNMVYLTHREHFIAHRLLAEVHGGKMSLAFIQMSNFEGKVSGLAYERHYIAAMKARSEDPVWIANNQAARDRMEADPEYCKARLKWFAKSRANPQFHINHAAAIRRMVETPEWQEQHRQHLEYLHSDPEIRAKVRAVVQARNSDPEFQRRAEASMKIVRLTPEFRAKMRAAAAQRYSDPDFCERHAAAVRKSRTTETFKENHRKAIEARRDNQQWCDSLQAMQQRKIKPVIGTDLSTGETVYLAGKQQMLAAGFDNRGVSRCIAKPERNKSYKGYSWRLATPAEIEDRNTKGKTD